MKHIHPVGPWEEGRGYTKRKVLGSEVLPLPVDMLQENRFKRGDSVPLHYHKVQTEIFYVLSKGAMIIDGERVEAEQGDIIVCEPGEVHGVPTVEKDFGFLVLKVDHRTDDTVWL